MDEAFYNEYRNLWESGRPFVRVTVVDVQGSVPSDPGGQMLVTAEGLSGGTIGGGRVENKAIGEACRMLEDRSAPRTLFVEWNLQKDVGMTCGGMMRLFLEVHHRISWEIVIFGAGHVAHALTRLLVQLDCRVTCYDSRAEWLDRLPESPRLEKVRVEDLPAQVRQIPDNAFVLLMTMGHATDLPVLIEIFKSNRRFPYLGVIGSAAKARRLGKDLEEAGLSPEVKKAFYCPIGLPIGSNHPSEIAVSVTAQLLEVRDALK